MCNRWRIRLACLALVAVSAWYVPWMLHALNGRLPWLSWPFAAANLYSVLYLLVTACNAWNRHVPPRRPVPAGEEPTVAVIIPTCGEPVAMVLRTVTSVLEQDWPRERLCIVVSDDGHDAALQAALDGYPVVYHSPPARWAPGRDGAAKAGNLNSAVALLDQLHPDIAYLETRDADDELGSNHFLRQVIGQLVADERLAYVQTIKEAEVSPGDPFNNRESMFYRGQMLARNAANAVFPCGSGVVWRRTALRDIGGFPTWNLVEDLQSGVEALRRGWSSMYLPIVGAVGQHSPEDVPNVYKQRGTWAIDTVRLLLWGELAGLSLRQRLHFIEMLMFYVNAFTVLVYVPAVAFSLLGWLPLDDAAVPYFTHMVPLVVATELWLLALNQPYNDRRGRQRHQIRALWRVRVMWTGMSPVYMRASVRALLGGPRHKPSYTVTRKTDDLRWHWRSILPQSTVVVVMAAVLAVALTRHTLASPTQLIGSAYWGGFNVVLFATFVGRSRHGLRAGASLKREHAAAPLAAHPEPPYLAEAPLGLAWPGPPDAPAALDATVALASPGVATDAGGAGGRQAIEAQPPAS